MAFHEFGLFDSKSAVSAAGVDAVEMEVAAPSRRPTARACDLDIAVLFISARCSGSAFRCSALPTHSSDRAGRTPGLKRPPENQSPAQPEDRHDKKRCYWLPCEPVTRDCLRHDPDCVGMSRVCDFDYDEFDDEKHERKARDDKGCDLLPCVTDPALSQARITLRGDAA